MRYWTPLLLLLSSRPTGIGPWKYGWSANEKMNKFAKQLHKRHAISHPDDVPYNLKDLPEPPQAGKSGGARSVDGCGVCRK